MAINFLKYPPFGKEDERYTYAVGRIRVLEKDLIPRSFFDRLAEAPDVTEYLKFLQETPYSRYLSDVRDEDSFERMLLNERREVLKTFDELCVDEPLKYKARARFDFHNIKVLLKSKIEEKSFDFALSDHGAVKTDELKQIFKDERYSWLPEHLSRAVEAGVSAFYENKSYRDLSTAVDRSMYDFLTKPLTDNDFFAVYHRLEADLINIRTYLRLRFLGTPELLKANLLPSGFLDTDVLLSEEPEGLVDRLSYTPYGKIYEEGFRAYKESGSLREYEKLMKGYLNGFLMETRKVDMGVEPLIAYLYFKFEEIRALRITFIGVTYRVNPEEIKESLTVVV